jgi:hypothetical protein
VLANEINNLVVRLSLDNVDFRQGIATSGRAVKTLQNELKSVSTGMGGFANANEQARAKVDVLNRIIEAQKEKVKSLRAAYDQNKAKLGENDAATQRYAAQVNRAVADLNRFENELKQVNRQADQKGIDKLSNTMKALQAELQSVSTGMGGFANRSEQAHAKVDVLNRMVDTQRQKVQQLSDAYNRSQQAEGATSQSTQRYAEQLHRATTELNRFETELQQANRHLDEQSNRMMNTGRHLETMGNNLQNAGMQIGLVFGGMAYAMGRGLKSAVQESMNFEQQMANIKAVSGATGTEMETLSKLAVKYGEDTKYSSVEAGKGIEELIKAGVSLTDIINGGLEGALNLASAGELELGEAAEIASTALNAFKKDGLSVTDAANLLAGAANASATDVHELKYGLSASAAVAAGAGMTFKDTATALAVFAQNGLKGSDAGTSLKTMLMRLNPSTKEAYNKMKDLGLITYNAQAGFDFLVRNGIQPASRNVGDIEVALEKYVMKTEGVTKWNDKCDTTFRELATSSAFLSSKFYDQEGHIESLENISGTLNESMKDLTDQQRSMALETLFGSDAVRGATILFNEGAKGVNNMYSEMSKTTALETAETKMNTMKGRIEQLGGAFDTMKKTIGDALMPVVSTMVGGLQFLVDGFNNLSPSVQKFISISAGVIFGLTAIAAVGATILAGIGGVIAGVGILTTSIASAGGVVAILGTAFAALTGPVGLTVLGIAGATAAIGYFINESQKASEETSKFGGRVSEGTRQAAGAYIDLKDKAINSMIDLKLKTGAEANKAADETIKAFQRMTNEVIKELEGKKSEFNKMFSQLMGSVPEGAQKTLEQVKNNVIESINKEIEVATKAETILEEGIKRYQGDTMKMPKDFAQKFDQALQVADKNVQQFYSKAKEITSISKEIESGGMLSVDAGRKRFESIIKVYDDGVKSLEKQTKGWRENVEKAFKMGEIKPEERKATLDAIALYEAKHVSDLQTIRGDGFKKLEEHLKAEDASLVFANANKIEAEKKGWAEKTKAYLFGKETYEEVSNRFNSEQEKAEKEHKDKLLAFELQYGNSKIESIGMYVGELQKGTESSRLLAESMAREIDGKMKIDLGPAGQFTIDTFLDKMKKGEIDSNAVATANVNKLKDVYKVDLSQSGIESMQKWIDGIKTKDTSQVREFLNKNMQGDTTIDLGIYGKMTMDSWITGLQNGTLSFDTVFQFFQQNVKNGVKVDATQEGQNNIQTLINGMQIGALSLPQVAQTMGLDIKSNVQVDLGAAGQFNVQTLVQGMQNGSINAEVAAKAIAALIQNGAKLDLTQVGFDISQTQANGITNNTAPENAATGKKQAVQGIMGSTTDGGGGSKSGSELGQGIISQDGYIRGSALQVVASAHSSFNTIDGNPAGNQGGQGVASGIVNQNGVIRGSALEAVSSAHGGFNTINGNPPGQKGGSEFAQGLENTKGQASASGKNVAESGKSGLGSVSANSVGGSFAEGFASGMDSKGSYISRVASGLAQGAFEAMKATLNINSPSRLVRDGAGKPFGEGFEVGISQSTRSVEKASRNLAYSAYDSLQKGFNQDSFSNIMSTFNESIPSSVNLSKGIKYVLNQSSDVDNNIPSFSTISSPSNKSYTPTNYELAQKKPLQIIINDRELAEVLLSPLDLLQGNQYSTSLFVQGVKV